MLNTELAIGLLIGCCIGCSFGFNFDRTLQSSNKILPWIGILRVKTGTNQTDAVTGLIIIQKQVAVGNANDVANVKIDTLRNFAKAMFKRNYMWWSCGVSDCTIHPEYFNGVKNTLALVYLRCDREDVYWKPISWPTTDRAYNNVYSVGFTDTHRRIQQVIYRMEAVTSADCDDFYETEKLDYKCLRPSYSICYRVLNSLKQCVIDAGMALAISSGSDWTLIGITTYGPSCSLPSRFIQFSPYIPWIKSNTGPMRTELNFRRSKYVFDKEGMEEPYQDQDTVLLQKINDNTIVLRPELAHVTETVHGKCDKIDGVLMYREFGTIRAPTYTATGVYSISLYDLFFPTITCVMVTVICNQRSQIRYWVARGFQQEDIEDYVKIIPTLHRNKPKPPRIWYLKDTYKKYRTIKTDNLEFKFEFTNEAKLDLEFYGRNISSPMRPLNVIFLSKQKQTSGKLPDGVDFNARDDETDKNLDTNDPFYHF